MAALLAGLLSLATSKVAATPLALRVGDRCEEVDPEKLQKAIELEVSSLLEGSAIDLEQIHPRFELECTPVQWSLTVVDDLTEKLIVRSIPPPQSLQERTVALAFSGLLLASWLELIVSEPADQDGAKGSDDKVVAAHKRGARQVASRQVRPKIGRRPSDRSVGLDAGLGISIAQEGALLVGPQLHLLLRDAAGWGVGARVEARAGEWQGGAARVLLSQWTLGAMGLLRLGCLMGCILRLEATGLLAFGQTELQGETRSLALSNRAVTGAHAQTDLGMVPGVQWRWLSISVPTSLRVTWLAPRGLLTAGGAVDPTGLSLVFGLQVGALVSLP